MCTIPPVCILIKKQYCRLETSQALKSNYDQKASLLLISCMALSNALNFFESQLPHLQNGC